MLHYIFIDVVIQVLRQDGTDVYTAPNPAAVARIKITSTKSYICDCRSDDYGDDYDDDGHDRSDNHAVKYVYKGYLELVDCD